ncbi:MAG: HYR domain-containing protein, partial [Planctomycetota bacterium]
MLDDLPPVVVVQDVTVYLDENGQGSVTFDDIIVSAVDDCGPVTITCDLPTVDCDNLGNNLVTIHFEDSAGNDTVVTVTVTVVDTIAPVFTCPEDLTVDGCQGPVEYIVPGFTDNCEAGLPDMLLIEGLCPGSVFPVGTTQVTYAGVDGSGNVTTCTFNVTVSGNCDPPPTGACCIQGNCSILDQASCLASGGIYFGDNTNCMQLKGSSLQYQGPEQADQWPMSEEILETARRWKVEPDRDLHYKEDPRDLREKGIGVAPIAVGDRHRRDQPDHRVVVREAVADRLARVAAAGVLDAGDPEAAKGYFQRYLEQ